MYEKIELDSLVIEITRKCNLNCRHCFNSGSGSGEMPLEVLESIVQEAMMYGVKEISLSGGEPLLHSQIFDIFEMLKKYPQIKFGLLTNGTLLNEKVIGAVEALENNFLQISFDGSQKEIYEANRGMGSFEKFWDGMELLAASKIKDKRTRTAVSVLNYKDVESICLAAYQRKVAPSFLFVAKLGNAIRNWEDISLSNVQKMTVNNSIRNFNKKYSTNIAQIRPAGRCGFSCEKERKQFTIDANGDVYTCDFFYDTPIGNVCTGSLKEAIQGQKLQKIYQYVKERNEQMTQNEICAQCDVKSECHYGCPGEAKMIEDVYGRDAQCMFRKLYFGCAVNGLI